MCQKKIAPIYSGYARRKRDNEMTLKYTKLVIDRSRFAAGQYDINLANEAEREVAAMQARIDTLEAGIRRIVNGEYDNARTILAAEKFARELLRGDE